MSWVLSQFGKMQKGEKIPEQPTPTPPMPTRRRQSIAITSAADSFCSPAHGRELTPFSGKELELSIGAIKEVELPENTFSCKICCKTFDVVEDVIVDSAEAKGKYMCRLCNKSTKNKLKLNSHAIKHLNSNEVDYCAKCQIWVGNGDKKSPRTTASQKVVEPQLSHIGLSNGKSSTSIASKSSLLEPRMSELITNLNKRRASTVLFWKNQISGPEKKMCDICGKMEFTRTIKGNVEACGACRISQVQKRKKDWRIKYISVINQLKSGAFDVGKVSPSDIPKDHVCQKCGKKIDDKRGLLNVLVKAKWQRRSPAVSTLSWDVMQVYYCLICGFKRHCFSSIRQHILSHFNTEDILYCRQCQQAINKICMEVVPDTGEINLLQSSPPTVKSPKMLGKASLQGVKLQLFDKYATVACGKCQKIFDHLIPLVQKIAEFHFEITGSNEKNISRKCYYYCRLCCAMEQEKVVIEKHVLRHVTKREVFCGSCYKYSSDQCVAKLIPVMARKETKSHEVTSGASYDEPSCLSSFKNLETDESTSDEDSKIFQAFLLSLRRDDFDDLEIFESILSSEWKFVYSEPPDVTNERNPVT